MYSQTSITDSLNNEPLSVTDLNQISLEIFIGWINITGLYITDFLYNGLFWFPSSPLYRNLTVFYVAEQSATPQKWPRDPKVENHCFNTILVAKF